MIQWKNHIAAFTGAHYHLDNSFILVQRIAVFLGIPNATVSAPALTEPLLVAGGQVITITLTDDTWVAAGSAFDQVRQIIINGIVSAQNEVAGWNVQRANIAVTDLVRTSNTVATLTLPALSGYNITVDEVLTDTVPDEALITSTSPFVATPTIGVTADAAIVDTHVLRFRSTTNLITFTSAPRRTTFQSVSSARIILKGTVQPLGFILAEDGAIITQENNLPIAKE